MTEEYTATLNSWELNLVSETEMCLRGYIMDDKKGRFSDGCLVRTSLVIEINFTEGWAKTLNSFYKLGGK